MNEEQRIAQQIESNQTDAIEADGSFEKPLVDSGMTKEEVIDSILKIKPECPPEILENLELINVKYIGFDEQFHAGQILVHKDLQNDIDELFKFFIENKFPIEKAVPMSEYSDDDESSMSENNTSGFNYRTVVNTNRISLHGFGFAIDLNPRINPVLEFEDQEKKSGSMIVTQPKNGQYDPEVPGTLVVGSAIVEFLKARGWEWGGDWISFKDYQHFEKPLPTKEYLQNLQRAYDEGAITNEQFETYKAKVMI